MRRLFIDKGNKPDGTGQFRILETSREFQQGGDTRPVIVRTRRADDGIIMCPDENDFVRIRHTSAGHLDIGEALPRDVIFLIRDRVA